MAKLKNKSPYKEVPCVIGVDQSYKRTGITIAVNGRIKKIYSLDFKTAKTKTDKRLLLQTTLQKAIDVCKKKFTPNDIAIIAERVRTFSHSEIHPGVIKAQAALIAYIVDTAYVNGILTYSVDTRAWKTRILGTSQPSSKAFPGVKNPQKVVAVKYIISIGHEEDIKIVSKTGGVSYNDDAADSACIALYGFSGFPYSLLLEQ